MKKLDKELYPEFAPDPNEPFREPIAKLGKRSPIVSRESLA